jgi:fermentation-respiration switch protein FrsA (DUF1100 family)
MYGLIKSNSSRRDCSRSFRFSMHLILLASLTFLMSGCSSLFYYPDQNVYVDVKHLDHKPDDIHFESEDGTQIHGWYFHSTVKKPKGAILYFHGNAQNLTAHFFFVYWLVDEGYDLMIFDYRGYGETAGAPTPENTVVDGRAALKWMVSHKPAKLPLVIFGQSLGGAIALRVAGELSQDQSAHYDAVVVDSTFASYEEVGRKVLSKIWLTWPFQYLSYLLLSDRWAPEDFIGKISPHPLLVVHGEQDQTVNYKLGRKVFELAKDPKEFWPIVGGRHTDFMFREKMRYQPLLLNWLDQNLSKERSNTVKAEAK